MTTTRDRQRENRIAIALRPAIPAILITAMYLAAGTFADATDCYFTSTTAGTVYFTNSANWAPGVPGPTDNANFTNNISQYIDFGDATVITNANAYFNYTLANGMRLWTRNATYWVTNSFIVGQNAGSSNYVWKRDVYGPNPIGTLAVTNAQGTARMIVGQEGQGRFDLTDNAVVDHLYVTNNGALVNDFLLCNNGNLTVRGDSTIKELNGGGYGGAYTSLWNVIGGTTTVQNNQLVGDRCTMIVTVSGANTVVNFQGALRIGQQAFNRQNGTSVIVTNGAVVNVSADTYVGYLDSTFPTDNNLLVVTGSNSLFNAANLYVGNGSLCTNNRVRVENGGCLTNSGSMTIGSSAGQGGSHQLILGGGGRVSTSSLTLQDNALTNTLKFVAIPGSTNMGVVNVSGALTIANANTAKLVVDMNQYTAWRTGVTSVVLVTYGTLTTPFSSGNIAVTPPPMLPMRITPTVDQSGGRIQVNLRVPKGTVVSGR